jgi:hypothetical protein
MQKLSQISLGQFLCFDLVLQNIRKSYYEQTFFLSEPKIFNDIDIIRRF